MKTQKTIRAALLGCGTVGGGVYKLLDRRKEELADKAGASLEISAVLVHNVNKKREGVDPSLLTDDFERIANDPSIDIVIEVMGGIEPARTMILRSLRAGKNVVTANKDLIAVHGSELLSAARENKVDLLFEAAVAGGIPIIRPLKQCLAGNELSDVVGIVNGPTADIEGLDAGRKVAILASTAFHSPVVFDDVYTEGITKISSSDIKYAKEFDCVIKLLGIARERQEQIEAYVCPMLLPADHPLATVRGSFNAVFVHGDAVDDVMFYGRGAGEFPTASAVVGDVIDVMRNMEYGCTGRIGCGCYRSVPVKQFRDVKNKFFIRMQVINRPGVLAAIAGELGRHKVSISKVVQKVITKGSAELVIVTEDVKEYHMSEALEDLKELEPVQEISSVIRSY